MTLEEAKSYRDKSKDNYIDKYLEFIYYNIKSSIDCGMDSCIVDFFIPNTMDDKISGILIVADENEMTDIYINKYIVSEITKRLDSDGYDINIMAFKTDDEYRVELDDFINNFEYSGAKSKFFNNVRYFELEVSGW